MAISRLLVATAVLSFLMLQLTHAHDHHQSNVVSELARSSDGGSTKLDRDKVCIARCQLSRAPFHCKPACKTWCILCSCVPSGTEDN
ncbi:unnamed protein product [Linum trigynum]|uniref:Uncharacterized protein n=1 Tax=Linum trigynum TaxID=586398 RepID=A0AAV2CGE1_9ROSI